MTIEFASLRIECNRALGGGNMARIIFSEWADVCAGGERKSVASLFVEPTSAYVWS